MHEAQGSGVVFFERNTRTQNRVQHMGVQSIAVPKDKLKDLRAVFQDYGRQKKLTIEPLAKDTTLKSVVGDNDFLHIEISDGTTLQCRVDDTYPPREFCRRVITTVIGRAEYASWIKCVESTKKETETAKKFTSLFKPYDHTQQ
mmetsp:Transcript_9888/g.10971  ORF Transcript_9888/g.10971 Transcript_9888/m.10971 type:complete len:144 (+) Transcript_9888:37-468(+)